MLFNSYNQPFVDCCYVISFFVSVVSGVSRYCPLSNGSQHDSITGIRLAPSVSSHPSLLSCYILTAFTRYSRTRSSNCVKRYINKTGIAYWWEILEKIKTDCVSLEQCVSTLIYCDWKSSFLIYGRDFANKDC